jgi:DNA-binding transcriptional regulator LsrR (DeoR family)
MNLPRENTIRARVVELRKKGLTRRQIAQELGLSQNDVNSVMAQAIKLNYVAKIDVQEMTRRARAGRGYVPKTDEVEKKILELKNSGVKTKLIATEVQQPISYVRSVLLRTKADRKKVFEESLIKLYREGLTYEEITKILHCSLRRVCEDINKLIDENKVQKRRTVQHSHCPRLR